MRHQPTRHEADTIGVVMDTGSNRQALVIAHEPDGPGGQVAVRLSERGFDILTHVVTPNSDESNLAQPFPDFDQFAVVAIMGSVRSLTNKDEIDSWIYDELDRIRQAHQQGVPMLGVCFGGQLIAEALGGSVETAPETELGWYEIDAVDGQENPAGPGPWMQWHHDRFHPPPQAVLLAETPRAAQLFRIGTTVGTQFHPEVDVAHIEQWLTVAQDDYLNSYGKNRSDILEAVRHHEGRNTNQCHDFVDWFIDDIVAAEQPGWPTATGEQHG